MRQLINILTEVAIQYPANLIALQLEDIPRIAFNICVALESIRPMSSDDASICDLGGGIGLFSVGCAAYGFKRVVLVDDFSDAVNQQVGPDVLDLHKSYGVEVVARDAIKRGISDFCEGFDIVTTFDSMEHWHHSPKKLFREVIAGLNPGGAFVLGVPNCVNLRKRITIPFGFGKWCSMQDWYEDEVFRGHVREPDVSDLQYIARDMGLYDVKIYGRNWLGNYSKNPEIRVATKIFDYPLRYFPSLCSYIYMVGKRRRS